jgi:hypothetical protein
MLQVFFVLVDLIYLDHLSLSLLSTKRHSSDPPKIPIMAVNGIKSERSGNTEILFESPLVQSRQAKYNPSHVNGDNITYGPIFNRRSVNPV